MNALLPNSTFAARYQIIRCIAAGGMGAVYEAVHLETERRRALKVMHAHFVQSAELRERFKREAKVAAQIDSDFVVDVFDGGIDDATSMPFLVMELLKGEELGKRLAAVGRFAVPEAITYLWQTALALDKTHRAQIVHRDLKPENLFLTEREDGPPRIKVLDFGVAKFVAETGTQSGQTRSLGTPLYMAPEQFRGQRVTAQADNFALAMMAYTLLVGAPYWHDEAGGDTDVVAFALRAHAGPQESARLRASRFGVALPDGFDAWFSKATATDPMARFASATATITALGEVLGVHPAMLTGVAASDPLRPSLVMGMSRSRPSMASMGVGTVAMPPLTGDVAALTRTTPRNAKKSHLQATIPIAALGIAVCAFAAWFFVVRQHAPREVASSASELSTPSVAPQSTVADARPSSDGTSQAEAVASASDRYALNSSAASSAPDAARPPAADTSAPSATASGAPLPGGDLGRLGTRRAVGATTSSPPTSVIPTSSSPPPPQPTYSRE